MTAHERVVADVFGITGEYTPLPGEIDENGKITGSDGRRYRLRISPPETEAALVFRRSVLEAAGGARVATPAPIPAADGAAWAHLADGRTAHLSTWVDGIAYSEVGRPPELAHEIGLAAGTIVNALAELPASSGIFLRLRGSSENDWVPSATRSGGG